MPQRTDEVTLVQMWRNALEGDKAAINALYMVALQGLPRVHNRDGASCREIVIEAAWKVLDESTTEGGELWVTDKGKVTLSKFRKRVHDLVAGQASYQTVGRYLKDQEEMRPVLHLYEKKYGLAKSE